MLRATIYGASRTCFKQLPILRGLFRYRMNKEILLLPLLVLKATKDVIQLLVKKGADTKNVNVEEKTLLMESLCFRYGSLSEFLVLEGASTSVKDKEGISEELNGKAAAPRSRPAL